MQSTQFNETQTEITIATPIDASGNPGVLQPGSVPSFSNSNNAAATVSIDPTGLILTLKGVAAGSTQVTLSGLSSAGAFSTTFGVTVTGGPAVGFTFAFGTPTP